MASTAEEANCEGVGYPPICSSSGRLEKLVDEFGGQSIPVMPSSARIGAQTDCLV